MKDRKRHSQLMHVFVDRNGDVAILVDHAEEVARAEVLLFGQRGMEQVPASTGWRHRVSPAPPRREKSTFLAHTC